MKLNDKTQLPIMIYDGDCGFCKHWVEKWERITGEHVRYKPYQQALAYYYQLTQKQCQESVQFVMPDGVIFSGAKAVFKAFDYTGRYRWLLWCYERLPFFGWGAELFYRLVAGHRSFLSKFYHAKRCCV